jgi:hypothetical protein
MAGEKHLLMTFGGGYVDSANSGEIWQNSLRLALVFGTVDNVGTLPTNWDPSANDINRTETHWTIAGNWIVSGPTGNDFDPGDWLNDYAAPSLDTWLATSGVSDEIRLDWIKLAAIGSNGKEVPAPPYSQGTPCLLTWTSANPTGDDGANLMPLQNSVVCSHRSNQTGRKGRGRMFRAGISTNSNDGVGRIGDTYVGNFLDAQVALLEGLSFTGVGGLSAHVRPAIIGSPWTHYGMITQVRVGNRMDTQRRRRDALVEAYTSATPSYG